ncbi:hypothetical protein [Micromonospora sp. NPDC023814]|uniref:hypothetical protein n=1 Tax=Micromonospora sp. NPDC023814 TaxID=3154596 RepID=UPI0033DD3FCB
MLFGDLTHRVGVTFVDDGSPYNPAGTRPALTDDEHAAWVLHKYGQADADHLAALHAAISGRHGWHRRAASGYAQHAICRRNGITSIVFRSRAEAGWRWQVWRDGDHQAVRSARGPVAATAEEAVRLADELAAKTRAVA